MVLKQVCTLRIPLRMAEFVQCSLLEYCNGSYAASRSTEHNRTNMIITSNLLF